jgi:hypothetical protein
VAYMKPLQNFEPGATTKKSLLFVMKKEKNITGTHWPGLFNDNHFEVMVMCFLFALGLEWFGLTVIIEAMDIGEGKGLLAVSALIFIDVLLAFGLHWLTVGPICRYSNKMRELPVLLNKTSAEIAAAGADYEVRIKRAKIYGFILALAIWALAGTKAFLFFSVVITNGGEMNSQVMLIIVTYLVVALIHVKCTGFAIAGTFSRLAWWFSERKYVTSGGKQNTAVRRHSDIVTTVGLIPESTDGTPLTVGTHTLEKLLRVDLVSRDQDGMAVALLGGSVRRKLEGSLREIVTRDYIENRNITKVEINHHEQAIEQEVRSRLRELTRVKVDPNRAVGILGLELRNFLQEKYAIRNEKISEVEKGQTLYRLETLGMLMDDELSGLTGGADTNGKNEIALHGLHLQLDAF